MYDNSNKGFLQEHQGSFQFDRLGGASLGAGMKVIDRTFEDLVKQSAEFARNVKFFNDQAKEDGTWTEFFEKVYDYDNRRVLTPVIDQMVRTRSVDPHLALLFAFYQMLIASQEDINTMTERQIAFYFKEVLGFQEKGGSEGKVTVFVDLKKNAGRVTIPKGTLFDAGKDPDGKRVTYASVDEVCLGHDEVGAISHYDNERGLVPVKEASAGAGAGSGAGAGAGAGAAADTAYTEGHSFCVSSPMLNQPGQKMYLYLEGADSATIGALKKLRAEYTGAKGWEKLECFTSNRKPSATELAKLDNFWSPVQWMIASDAEPIAPYDPAVHGGNLGFEDPVIRFTSDSGISTLSAISLKSLKGLKIKVSSATNIKVMNQTGEVENKAGNNPFGHNCRLKDTFWVELPFPAEAAKITYSFKDSLKVYDKGATKDIDSRILKWTYALDDARSDQFQMTNDYSKAVLTWMKDKVSGSYAIDNAIKKGLMAITPTLSDSIRLYSAVYRDTAIKTSLQFPYGSYGTNGLDCPTDAIRILNSQSTCILGLGGMSETGAESGSSGTDQQVSLYVKMADNAWLEPGKVTWCYLAGGNWMPFDSGSVLKDTTDGLSRSGIVMLSLSNDIFQDNGGMSQEFRWIRAVADNSNASMIADVIPGAVELEFNPFSEGAGPGGKILPAGTISKLAGDLAGIKSVTQPFDGQAGRLAETEATFYRRVSERLRHKNRAWSAWDYEHLVLERFAHVAYVKCLPSYNIGKKTGAGSLTLLVVPESSASELKPAPDNVLRNDITEYVQQHCSPFVKVNVCGPAYKEVLVNVSLHLRDGYFDTAGYASQINEELKEFLKTWTGTPGEKGHFRSGAGKSEVIAFLEALPYVDYIDGLDLNAGNSSEDEDEILVSRPHELLTSAPSHKVKCYLAETHIV